MDGSKRQAPGNHPPVAARSDLGRRLVARREQLGLTRKQIAERVGASAEYIAYVEDRHDMPGLPFLVRLADALETTVAGLTGAAADRPPGRSSASRHASLVALTAEECRALLSTHGVGRVAVHTSWGPAILPVNYLMHDESVNYRTSATGAATAAVGHEVAFEADHIDEVWRQGWSVNVIGDAHAVTGGAARNLDRLAYSLPWAGEHRHQWITVVPRLITGRRVSVE